MTDVRTTTALRVIASLVVLGLAAGLVLLWPGTLRSDHVTDTLGADELVHGTVTSVDDLPCEGTDPVAGIGCAVAHVELGDGTEVTLPEDPDDGGVGLHEGDDVVLARFGSDYAYADRDRSTALLAIVAVALLAVVAVARLRGARALAAIVAAIAVITVFVVPALLDGRDPVLVAIVGAGVAVLAVTALRHGIDGRAQLIAVGAVGGLVVVAGLAWACTALTDLAGLAAGDAGFLQVSSADVELRGLVLAGIVLGAVGALVEVASRQVREVTDLRDAGEGQSRRAVIGVALAAGREHLAAATTTLGLAYAGAALPVLLLLTQAREGVTDVGTSELVATEVLRTVVGVAGLAAVVPITTVLTAWVVGQRAATTAHTDPRRYASRAERQLWEAAHRPAPAPAEPEPPLPPDRAL